MQPYTLTFGAIQEDGGHPNRFRATHIRLGTIPHMYGLVRYNTRSVECRLKNPGIGLLGADFTGNGHGIEITGQPNLVEQRTQALVPIGNNANMQAAHARYA